MWFILAWYAMRSACMRPISLVSEHQPFQNFGWFESTNIKRFKILIIKWFKVAGRNTEEFDDSPIGPQTSLPGFFSLLSCPQPKCPIHHVYTVFEHKKHHTCVRQCLFRPFWAFAHTRGPGSPHGIVKRPFPPPQKGLKNSPNLLMKSFLWCARDSQNLKVIHYT